MKQRVSLDAWRRRGVHGRGVPFAIILVKQIYISIEAEHVFMARIVVPQSAKIFNIGGRDHASLIG
jgi:hypothetical protein